MSSNSMDAAPEWQPRCLVQELAHYDQLAETAADDPSRQLFPHADSEQAILRRLLNERTMQAVWRSLALKCRDKGESIERFAEKLWLNIILGNQQVRITTETPADRKKSLAEASQGLRRMALKFERHREIEIEASHILSAMIASNLQRIHPNAEKTADLLFDGANAWAALLNNVDQNHMPNPLEALGAALSISLTDAMAMLADRLDAAQTMPQEVKHRGKPLPVLIPRLNQLFMATFGQPYDDTVAEIITTALDLEKPLDRSDVRAYVRASAGNR